MTTALSLIWVAVLFFIVFRKRKRDERKAFREHSEGLARGVEQVASDGHKISAEDDISCARYGHDHSRDAGQADFAGDRFIVHDEPTEGYINLNGKILKRSEADEYMRRHG